MKALENIYIYIHISFVVRIIALLRGKNRSRSRTKAYSIVLYCTSIGVKPEFMSFR